MDTRWQMVLQMVADLLELRGGSEDKYGDEDAGKAPTPLREFADAILGSQMERQHWLESEDLRVTGDQAIQPYLNACSLPRNASSGEAPKDVSPYCMTWLLVTAVFTVGARQTGGSIVATWACWWTAR